MKRRVLTLDDAGLSRACSRLEALVRSTGFEPDTVVGIRNGGEQVAALMFPDAAHSAVTLRRPSSKHKRPWMARVMRFLPRPVLDRMRIFESWMLSRRKPGRTDAASLDMPDLKNAERILIVDDSVDSGVTLDAVVAAAKLAAPDAAILSAVLTVTTARPIMLPDFALYNNLTLIRFPWSMDYK